jgi:cytochrome c oxidase assembly protein subunit 15
MAHRVFAGALLLAAGALAWALWRQPPLRTQGVALAALLLAQLISGLSNVVLDWPLVAALAHSAGAAALVLLLTLLLARSALRSPAAAAQRAAVAT